MKSATILVTDQLIVDMEPKEIFRRLAQLQPHHWRIWARSFARWQRKNAL